MFMLAPIFKLAAVSPRRQAAFRQLVTTHLLIMIAGSVIALSLQVEGTPLLGHAALIAGIIEGAIVLGWRLVQIPKSQSLEFLLVSPLRPTQLFLGEALVGLTQLALITLSGLPLLLFLVLEGVLWPSDIPALIVMPWTWGAHYRFDTGRLGFRKPPGAPLGRANRDGIRVVVLGRRRACGRKAADLAHRPAQ